MRKILATVLCAVVAMGYFMVNSGKSEPMSELMQANVDALGMDAYVEVICEGSFGECITVRTDGGEIPYFGKIVKIEIH